MYFFNSSLSHFTHACWLFIRHWIFYKTDGRKNPLQHTLPTWSYWAFSWFVQKLLQIFFIRINGIQDRNYFAFEVFAVRSFKLPREEKASKQTVFSCFFFGLLIKLQGHFIVLGIIKQFHGDCTDLRFSRVYPPL